MKVQPQLVMPLACPCCGLMIPPKLTVTGYVRRSILRLVSERRDGITTHELRDLIYATDPNGGPQLKSVSANIWHLNKQLRPQGYEVSVQWRGRGAPYCLRKLDADTPRPTLVRTEHAGGVARP